MRRQSGESSSTSSIVDPGEFEDREPIRKGQIALKTLTNPIVILWMSSVMMAGCDLVLLTHRVGEIQRATEINRIAVAQMHQEAREQTALHNRTSEAIGRLDADLNQFKVEIKKAVGHTQTLTGEIKELKETIKSTPP